MNESKAMLELAAAAILERRFPHREDRQKWIDGFLADNLANVPGAFYAVVRDAFHDAEVVLAARRASAPQASPNYIVGAGPGAVGPACACCEQQPRADCTIPGCINKTVAWASAPQGDGRALEPLAKLALWRDTYPDGPDRLTDHRLQGYFTPDQVRAARAALSAPPSVALEATREEIARTLYERHPAIRFSHKKDHVLNRAATWDEATADERLEDYEAADAILALTRPQPGGA